MLMLYCGHVYKPDPPEINSQLHNCIGCTEQGCSTPAVHQAEYEWQAYWFQRNFQFWNRLHQEGHAKGGT